MSHTPFLCLRGTRGKTGRCGALFWGRTRLFCITTTLPKWVPCASRHVSPQQSQGCFHLQPSSQSPYNNFHPRCLSFHSYKLLLPVWCLFSFITSSPTQWILLSGSSLFWEEKHLSVPPKLAVCLRRGSWADEDSWLVLSSLFSPLSTQRGHEFCPLILLSPPMFWKVSFAI